MIALLCRYHRQANPLESQGLVMHRTPSSSSLVLARRGWFQWGGAAFAALLLIPVVVAFVLYEADGLFLLSTPLFGRLLNNNTPFWYFFNF